MTPLEQFEINHVLKVLRSQGSLKKAADILFAGKQNPSDRLRKKLLRYGIHPKAALSPIH